MRETDWVAALVPHLSEALNMHDASIAIEDRVRLPYTNEVRHYTEDGAIYSDLSAYQTDLLVREHMGDGSWKPRLVIEVKLRTINTHAAITYSQKAATHKEVHPYLRYGILLAKRKHYPLPGRLFRHGAHFDFMLSWRGLEPTGPEFEALIDVILDEVRASRELEEIIYESRNPNRQAYTLLHRPLLLNKIDEG